MTCLNDNKCECGHLRTEHVIDGSVSPKWCKKVQKECDCWVYKPRNSQWINDEAWVG